MRRLEVTDYPYRMEITNEAFDLVEDNLSGEVDAGSALIEDRGGLGKIVGCDDPNQAVYARLADQGFKWLP